MGNDGGSIPTRRELVKEAARNPTTTQLKETLQEQQEFHWSTDPLSNKPLSRPIVSDSSGRLYNKDSIIEYLLPSDDASSKVEAEKILAGAVKSLKDVVEIKFEVDQDEDGEKQNGAQKKRGERFICPMTNKPLGLGSKAVYLVPCGHAFSSVAIKEISGDLEGKCLQCNESYAPNDVIPIIPTIETDIARLQLRIKILKEKGLSHSLKKDKSAGKKRKKGEKGEKETEKNGSKDENAIVTAASTEIAGLSKLNGIDEKKASAPNSGRSTPQPNASKKSSDGIKNAATASLTAKVLEEQEQRNKRRKVETNDNLKSLFRTKERGVSLKNSGDFMNRGFSLPAQQKQKR